MAGQYGFPGSSRECYEGEQLSDFRPTLRCPCEWRFCETKFSYSEAPAGETGFDFETGQYSRRYDRCTLCGHYISCHEMNLSGLYEGEYLDATYGDADGMRKRLETILALPPERSDNAGRVRRIEAFLAARGGAGSGRRLLDIGAGIGVFPAAMKNAGWNVTAIEPDQRTADYLTDVLEIAVYANDLFELTAESIGTFDLVTLNKVLEHVEDPVAMLDKSREFVSPGGVMYLELPDVAAAAEGANREEFFIEHHHVFSPASLAATAARAAFSPRSIERLREPSGKFTLRSFLEPNDAHNC